MRQPVLIPQLDNGWTSRDAAESAEGLIEGIERSVITEAEELGVEGLALLERQLLSIRDGLAEIISSDGDSVSGALEIRELLEVRALTDWGIELSPAIKARLTQRGE